ncbi:type II toxin-antitoxin system VapC family toxin [Aquipuribacter sp. SD81]|uniref:type II toxin-antitoxin system VapC family toxin n=1 Tax=Aquipuribacter sp. SD81 TaxID=3127703 RepID=UPI00301931A1
MIVLDAKVLIAVLDTTDAHHERSVSLLLERSDESLSASTVTLAEVLVGAARAGRLEDGDSALRALGVRELPLPEGSASRLARLRADTRLKLPDCCVLLTAETHRAILATFDERLLAVARQKGVPVVEPL